MQHVNHVSVLMARLNLTQQDLASIENVRKDTVAKWLSGKMRIPEDVFNSLRRLDSTIRQCALIEARAMDINAARSGAEECRIYIPDENDLPTFGFPANKALYMAYLGAIQAETWDTRMLSVPEQSLSTLAPLYLWANQSKFFGWKPEFNYTPLVDLIQTQIINRFRVCDFNGIIEESTLNGVGHSNDYQLTFELGEIDRKKWSVCLWIDADEPFDYIRQNCEGIGYLFVEGETKSYGNPADLCDELATILESRYGTPKEFLTKFHDHITTAEKITPEELRNITNSIRNDIDDDSGKTE